MRVTHSRSDTVDPCATTASVARSHIIPGPSRGYSNSSISDVITLRLRRGTTAFVSAFHSESVLMRCAAQSAWMSVAGMPHTFSV